MKNYVQDVAAVLFRLYFQDCLSCVYNCDGNSCLYTLLRSSNIRSFTCIRLHLWNITNSQRDEVPVGSIAQLVQH